MFSRGHVGAFLALAFAVFGGGTLVTAGAVLTETGLRAQVPPERLAHAQLLVSAPQRVPVDEDFDVRLLDREPVPADLAERIARVPGVEATAADVTLPVSVSPISDSRVRSALTADAHDWAVAALASPPLHGSAPAADSIVLTRELATDLGESLSTGALETGDRVDLSLGDTRREVRVAGIVDAPGAAVHLSTATVASITRERVDLIAVRLDDGADTDTVAEAVRDAVGPGFVVTTGDARGAVEALGVGNARLELLALATSIAGTLPLLVGCITASALATAIAGQRRELALLRAVGATPRQVRDLVAGQATVAAAVGLAPALLLGYVLAGWCNTKLAAAGVVSVQLPVVVSPLAGAVVALLTLTIVRVSARAVALRASRRPATEAIGEAQVEPRPPTRVRTGLGLALLGLGVIPAFAALVIRGEDAFLSAASGTLAGIVGLALAGPVLVRAVTGRLARGTGEGAPVTRWLAVRQTRAHALRSAGSVTVLALAFSVTAVQVYAQSTLERATAHEQTDGVTAAARIVGAMTPVDLADVAEVDGVEAAVPMVSTSVLRSNRWLGETTTERFSALAVGPDADRVLDLDAVAGDLAALRGESVALDATTARRWGVGVGEQVALRLGNGEQVDPVVVATYQRGLGFGTVVASTDLLTMHGLARSYDTVLVQGDAQAIDGLEAWADDRPGQRVTPLTADAALTTERPWLERWLGVVVLIPMLGYVLVAVAASLRTTTRRRREEFATLRMLGATPRQVLSMVTREAVLLSGLAVAAGIGVAVLPMSILGAGVLGRPWPQGPLWVLPAIATILVVIAVGSMRGTTGRLLRRSVSP
ncbi:ABC transporter permease [Aeromicrobium camelliae]|uniref:ABC transporter permease n=1 Tax=Aeromicrobium camelliae TaxID=1538144 RepID=UPI00140D4B58|nr:ABC transporter permease [Aeromicrobium camelliae]